MLRVGLTGNIGSGKSLVASIFQTLGTSVFCADAEAKKLYERNSVKDQIRRWFGSQIFTEEGVIDRKALAGIIFNDEDELKKVNELIHPLVRESFHEWISERQNDPYVIYEAAILFESGHYKELDKIILVTAPADIRIKRVMERDGIPREDVLARMAHQCEEEKKMHLADFIIRNDGKEMVIPQVMEVHRRLMLSFEF
jgi:dephospho-CoA kinase